MLLDALLTFDLNAAHLTTGASTNVINLGAVSRNLGAGEPLYLLVQVTAAFTDSGSDSTMTVTLQTDSVENFASPATAMTLGTFGALSAAGSSFVASLPYSPLEQYARVYYTVANGDLTTGSFTASIVKQSDMQAYYADAITIS